MGQKLASFNCLLRFEVKMWSLSKDISAVKVRWKKKKEIMG